MIALSPNPDTKRTSQKIGYTQYCVGNKFWATQKNDNANIIIERYNIKPEYQMTIEILKLIISFLTPIIILILGLLINKSIERNKKSLLQEKEWQVRWAETFLIRAIKFEENISVIVTTLSQLQENMQNKNGVNAKKKENDLLELINDSIANIQYLEWDIQNFAQFAAMNSKDLINKQLELTNAVRDIFVNKQGDLEKIRAIQFDYNKLVRKAHSEILNAV
ncbi:MAG: hypothetical protein JXQ65_06675 [Candidatus Marinimicrobia bacterium]|nr:hypothetical protein [Candidatus Neomarinimicrobiota bacterium]